MANVHPLPGVRAGGGTGHMGLRPGARSLRAQPVPVGVDCRGTVVVLRDSAGTYYALPTAVLGAYRVPGERLAELGEDRRRSRGTAARGLRFAGGVLQTAVHIQSPKGGGRR